MLELIFTLYLEGGQIQEIFRLCCTYDISKIKQLENESVVLGQYDGHIKLRLLCHTPRMHFIRGLIAKATMLSPVIVP